MKLSLPLLAGLAQAQETYKSERFVYVLESLPGTGIIAGYDTSYRPMELMYLNDIREQMPAILDVNVEAMGENGQIATARRINKFVYRHFYQRTLDTFNYYLIMQAMYQGDLVQADVQAAITAALGVNAKFEGDPYYTQAMDLNPDFAFREPGLYHESCRTSEQECRYFDVNTQGCYEAYQGVVDFADQTSVDDAKANLTSVFSNEFDAFYGNTTFFPGYVSKTFEITDLQEIDQTGGGASLNWSSQKAGSDADVQLQIDGEYSRQTSQNLYKVCFNLDTRFEEVDFAEIRHISEYQTDAELFMKSLTSYSQSAQTADYSYKCEAPDCEPIAVQTRCTGKQTFNEDLSDNGFLAELGEGLYIESIRKGRGKDTPFDDPMYNGELYFDPDVSVIRLACKNGYDNNIGKPMMGTKCLCNNGICKWTMNKEYFGCVSHENEQQIPVWGGGTFNFVKTVKSSYITLKARISNLVNAESWSHDQVDTVAHPEYLDPEWWKTAPFTAFVWCPFDVTKGGFRGNDGLMTFGDFHYSEHSPDGHLWSFLSRSNTKLWKKPICEKDETGTMVCTYKSTYFKVYADRSTNITEQGPVDYSTDFKTGEDYSCETGILPGHQKFAIQNMINIYPIFENGTFGQMVNYFRQTPDWLADYGDQISPPVF